MTLKHSEIQYLVLVSLQLDGCAITSCHHHGWCSLFFSSVSFTVGPNDRNPPRITSKTWGKWMLILLSVTVWPIVNIRRVQSPEMENILICWNNSWNHSNRNHFVAGFTNLSPLCTGWLQPRFHSLYRVLSALPVITIFVGYKPSKRSFGISIFVETLIASNPTGRIFVFERCARESTLKYAGCARGLFFREKNACDGGKIQYPKKIC